MTTTALPLPSRWRQFNALTKPRVIQLIVFCALIGMVLAVPGVPAWADVGQAAVACLGIWLVAGAAAAGRPEWQPLYAGQGLGAARAIEPAADVVRQVVAEAAALLGEPSP